MPARPTLKFARRSQRLRAFLWGRVRLPARAMNVATLGKLPPPDVCILGSGPAGAVLGLDLAQRGWRIVIVESAGDQLLFGPRRYVHSAGEIDYPSSQSRFLGFGGSSVLWNGACTRLRPIDFERNAYTPGDAQWPIAYADLERYYETAEQSLGVRGSAACPRPPGAGATMHADEADHPNQAVIALKPSRVARSERGPDVYRVARDLLPRYCGAGRHAMLGIGQASTLRHDGDGHVDAVVLRDHYGRTADLQAGIFVIACGGIETPRLLLRSRSASFPEGLGNESGLVGRFFMEHLKLRFRASVRGGSRVVGRSFQYYEELKQRGLGSAILNVDAPARTDREVMLISADVEMLPVRENRVALTADQDGRPGVSLTFSLSERDLETTRAVQAMVRRIYRQLGATQVESVPGHHGMVSWLYHHMGTCRMGSDPENSVTDSNLRVHGSPNLYLAGSAPFVTGGGSNPTLTIAALSHRLADHLHARLTGPA